MGNKLSGSCAPLIRSEQAGARGGMPCGGGGRRGDIGHLFRMWAEVFHVNSSGGGTIKWEQVSEHLVPVNITCIQDSPECVFHITAYNSQVDKILDVRLVQPGTRIGQASESFVYWKDTVTNDTWGLNFTSPIEAKQFRECYGSYNLKKRRRPRAKEWGWCTGGIFDARGGSDQQRGSVDERNEVFTTIIDIIYNPDKKLFI